jgi:hypothetical protein
MRPKLRKLKVDPNVTQSKVAIERPNFAQA